MNHRQGNVDDSFLAWGPKRVGVHQAPQHRGEEHRRKTHDPKERSENNKIWHQEPYSQWKGKDCYRSKLSVRLARP